MIQVITLDVSGYVAPIVTDIGKLVTDDTVTIGVLSSYDNVNKTWYIDSPTVIEVGSVMAITTGTGAGTVTVASTSSVYCTKADIKDRMLIASTDTTYDTSLDIAIIEASRTVDIFLKPYVTVPLVTYDDAISIITADMSSSIFKRRLMPSEVKLRGSLQPDMINDVDGTGWFAVGLKKLLDYIKSYYALLEPASTSSAMVNPEVYMELFKNGTVTLKEARALMANASSVITKKLNEISTLTKTEDLTKTDIENITIVKSTTDGLTKTDNIDITKVNRLTDTESATKTLVKNLTDNLIETKNKINMESNTKLVTEREYKTKKQKMFTFVEGNPDTLGTYKEQSD